MSDSQRGPSLAAAIAQARVELEQARAEGLGKEVQFQVTEMELEFAVDLVASTGANAGIRLSVLSFGAKGDIRRSDNNRVRVKLKPVSLGGEDIAVGSDHERRPDYHDD